MLSGAAVIAAAAISVATPTLSLGGDGDWTSYNGDYRDWRFSPLDQINASNVDKLSVAWIHQPGDITQGLQATPLAVDGLIYYIAANNRVFAADGATGAEIWHYYTELDPITAKLFFAAYNRGVAIGGGKVFFGTLDGRLIALDQQTGKKIWATTLVDTKNCNGCNFTSPPTVAGDVIIIGQTGGDFAQHGRIFGVKADSGEQLWAFDVINHDPKSWPTANAATNGGGGAWLPGTYDAKSGLYYVGTSNAAPDFDGSQREGDNLYTATLLAMDPKTGKIVWYHQEVPHDVWDFDSAYEIVFLDKDGKEMLFHLNKGGFVSVLDRKDGAVENVWPLSENITWAKTVDPQTGALVDRNEPVESHSKLICPSALGARSWNHGAYSPKTGLWYTNANEICEQVKVGKQDPKEMAFAQPYFNFAELTFVPPPSGTATSRLEAVDPLTGKKAWQVNYALPGLGAVLATAGDLVFNGDVQGWIHAYGAKDGKELWSFNTGSGIRSGPISYSAKGKQYILVPAGFGSLFPAFAGGLYPAFKERGGGALIAFEVK
jgi:alcohol dehydrogenase (cytochrome c)